MMQFDELHIISDLHLGGEPGFQIFGSTAELVVLIDSLAAAPTEKSVALVINGDFIDFLAEQPAAYFDPKGAVTKLIRIMGDPSFAPIFAALKRFLRAQLRTLIINLGNHDLELALPWVREQLVESLCSDNLEARGRFRMVTDGTGVLCRVGNAQVLCVHGNEVDSWNVADYEQIRRIGRDISFRNPVAAWIPNAGTQMVIQVMNEVKRQFPFVDLLKPETQGVVPTLLALDPSMIQKLRGAAVAAGRRAFDAARMATGFLGDGAIEQPQNGTTIPFPAAAMVDTSVGMPLFRDAAQTSARDLMAFAEDQTRKNTEPMDLVRGEQSRQLGWLSAAWNLVTGKPTHEVLREALEKLDQDKSFEFYTADDTFKWLDELTGAEIDFLVAGHTHLERALRRRKGRGCYFNSGTWARLIQVSPEVRGDLDKFKRLFDLLRGGDMKTLDSEPGLVRKRGSIVSIFINQRGQTCAELRRIEPGEKQPKTVTDSLLAIE